jgi:hypothetical protein
MIVLDREVALVRVASDLARGANGGVDHHRVAGGETECAEIGGETRTVVHEGTISVHGSR